ncbi:GPI mannosyltransferase 2 [Corynebacterium halotolerans YIM 70093 = DSM 44683]|uniref:GPI mannosyltransferase 2 n=1 Tax=Corynebacterium halotolerans YIM 70093 = DSM 44683 TaxID=1121362 RepID=M1NUZ2_9CORY|nr:GPI mannosyltransferase 2 [Corynebacterium halotolerans YIM 70093 = DSM 44683]
MPVTSPEPTDAEPTAHGAAGAGVDKRLDARDWLAAALVAVVGTLIRVGVLGLFARANDEGTGGLLASWDTRYYLAIAEHGYFDADLDTDGPVHEYTLAFFPGFPALVRLVHELTRLDYAAAAVLLNILLTIVMTAGGMALAARMGAGRAGRTGAAVLVSSAPMAVTFTMPYTEALFGALAFWALVALIDRRWWPAAGLILLAGLTRLTAVDLVLVFAVVVLLRARGDRRAWAALAVSPLSFLGYLAFANFHTRDAGGYFGIQEAGWGSRFDFGAATVRWMVEVLLTGRDPGYFLTVGVMVAAVIALVPGWRRVPWEIWLFCAALTANVLLADGIMHSRPRLLLPAVIILLPWVLRGARKLSRGWQAAVAAGWVIFGAWFSGYMLTVFEWAI